MEQKKCHISKCFCTVGRAGCNSATVFYSHIHSRVHRIQVENQKPTPFCKSCNGKFESQQHLECHTNSAAHLTRVKSMELKSESIFSSLQYSSFQFQYQENKQTNKRTKVAKWVFPNQNQILVII